MKETTAHLNIICQDWTKTLQFYKTLIPHFKKRLVEIASKNTSVDIRKKLAHFKNEFIVLNEDLDELQYNVNLQQDWAMETGGEKPLFINVRMVKVDDNLDELIDSFEMEFAKIKKQFYRFLSNKM